MARLGPKLEREQLLLGRFVDIAAELFAMAASCARATAERESDEQAANLADYFCRSAKLRVKDLFRSLHHNEDRRGYRLAQELLTKMPASLQANPGHRIAPISSGNDLAPTSEHREAA
jgi:hypothetical protein